jgi:hypothetical protein
MTANSVLDHHPTLSPSSLPALASCPRYRKGPGSEAAERGRLQHETLSAMLQKTEVPPSPLTAGELDQVLWAANHISQYAGMNLHVEERLSLVDHDFAEITFGTADAIAIKQTQHGDTLTLFDYKSGEQRNYRPQMAAYALMAMDRFGFNLCHVHEVYGRFRWVEKYTLSRTEADAIVYPIIEAVNDTSRPASLCGYCAWCADAGTCPLTTGAITAVAARYDPDNPPVPPVDMASISTWHGSEITDPAQAAVVWRVAQFLAKWAESAKHGILRLAQDGMSSPA